jgi:hypothetical protein
MRRDTLPVFEPNPPWLNSVLGETWPAIERRVGPELMPSRAEGEGRSLVVEEYGCGHYGCVVPTSNPDIVMKLTSDPLEAHFVAAALRIGKPPLGIVHYASVYQLPAHYRRRALYVLWRESAESVGGLTKEQGGDAYEAAARRHFRNRLERFKYLAVECKRIVDRAADMKRTLSEAARYEVWAREHVELHHVEERDVGYSKHAFAQFKGAQRLAALLRGCEIVAELMEHEPEGDLVGEALSFYMQNGLLLADVHANNVGRVRRVDYSKPVWAITDPGHAVPLDMRFETVTVDGI